MANRFLQSLLGEEEYEQARGTAMNNAMLMAGLQGLLASGPSSMPVGLGQVIGQAGMTGLGAYGASMEQTGQQAGQLMELDSMRQEQAHMEQEMEADEAFRLAAQEVMAGGRVNYNALQQLALAFPERAGPLISALQSARPPQAPQVNLQFDSRTGAVFNPATGQVTMAEGFTPQQEETGRIMMGPDIDPSMPNQPFWFEPGKPPAPLPSAVLDKPEQVAKALPVMNSYNLQSAPIKQSLSQADNALQALQSGDDFAVQRTALSWMQSMNIPVRGNAAEGFVTESGPYQEFVRLINQTRTGEQLRDEQRKALQNQILEGRQQLTTDLNRIQGQFKPLFEGLQYSKEEIENFYSSRAEDVVPGENPVRITTDEEYNQLAPGTLYAAPDGTVRRKSR